MVKLVVVNQISCIFYYSDKKLLIYILQFKKIMMIHIGVLIAFDKLSIINLRLMLGNLNIMQSLKLFLPLTLAMFLIFTTFQPEASTNYADKSNLNASNNIPGTKDAPWAAIQKGVEVAQAGDTVYVKYAIYNEDITMVNSGNVTAGISHLSA